MKKLLAISLLLGSTTLVLAQQPVINLGLPVTTFDGSGSISSTNTFQSVFGAQSTTPGVAQRKGCVVINTSMHEQFLFLGSITSATTPDSIPLNAAAGVGQAGGTFNCASAGVGIPQDQISITGTSGDTFVAKQQ